MTALTIVVDNPIRLVGVTLVAWSLYLFVAAATRNWWAK
jgi:hypothetical protein